MSIDCLNCIETTLDTIESAKAELVAIPANDRNREQLDEAYAGLSMAQRALLNLITPACSKPSHGNSMGLGLLSPLRDAVRSLRNAIESEGVVNILDVVIVDVWGGDVLAFFSRVSTARAKRIRRQWRSKKISGTRVVFCPAGSHQQTITTEENCSI